MEDLKPEQRLGMDLGFDSLMRVDLYVSLTEAFPGARDPPQTMIGGETTIEELARSVAGVIAGTEKAATSENIGRRTVVSVNRPLRTSSEGILGVGLEDEPVADGAFIRLSTDEYPWLEDHRIGGEFLVPFAFMLDQAVADRWTNLMQFGFAARIRTWRLLRDFAKNSTAPGSPHTTWPFRRRCSNPSWRTSENQAALRARASSLRNRLAAMGTRRAT